MYLMLFFLCLRSSCIVNLVYHPDLQWPLRTRLAEYPACTINKANQSTPWRHAENSYYAFHFAFLRLCYNCFLGVALVGFRTHDLFPTKIWIERTHYGFPRSCVGFGWHFLKSLLTPLFRDFLRLWRDDECEFADELQVGCYMYLCLWMSSSWTGQPLCFNTLFLRL